MNKITEQILHRKIVADANGREYPLHSETSPAQGEFLAALIAEIDARVCVEVGLAFGISSLFIAEAIAPKSGRRLISIDPFQSDWHDIGLLNLERAGYQPFVEFYRERSHDVLPRLLAAGDRIDFAYVDASKVFDVVLIHAYYLTRLLKVGGLLVFDDCQWPGIRKLMRYLARWPHLEISHRHNVGHSSRKRRFLSRVIKAIPGQERIFADSLVRPDEQLGTNAQCLAFRKIAEDERKWDWHRDF